MSAEPAPPTNLVALRDRRDKVIASLTEYFAADVLDVDEFDARLDAAHSATSIVALDRLVADLAPLPADAPAVAPTAMVVRDDPHRPEHKKMTTVFGGFDRNGAWVVPRKMRIRTWFGGGRLDFRDADFGPGITELQVSCVMGGMQIIVPPQLAVDCDVSSVMGGVDQREAPATPDPGRAILRITGVVVMGGLQIETRLAGESERQANKRRKLERRGRRALPAPGSDGKPST